MRFASDPATILLVDDDQILLQVLSRVLTRAGYIVLRAASVAEALQQAESAPELVLLDLCLPDGSGLDLAVALHAREPGLPLILMTAYPLQLQDRPELMEHFKQVLIKPPDLQDIRRRVAAALEREAPPVEARRQRSPMFPASLTEGPTILARRVP